MRQLPEQRGSCSSVYAPKIVGNYVGSTSDDGDCVDLRLEVDHWQIVGPPLAVPLAATLKSAFRTLRFGSKFAGTISANRNESQCLTKSQCRVIVSGATSLHERENWIDGCRDETSGIRSIRLRWKRKRTTIAQSLEGGVSAAVQGGSPDRIDRRTGNRSISRRSLRQLWLKIV